MRMFVTVFFGVFDPVAGSLTFANAGHPMPLRLDSLGAVSELALPVHLPLGLRAGQEYCSSELELAPGDTVFAFSDGVTDAVDPQGMEFGDCRLRQSIVSGAGLNAQDCIESVLLAIRDFSRGSPQSDDVTCLALHRRPHGFRDQPGPQGGD